MKIEEMLVELQTIQNNERNAVIALAKVIVRTWRIQPSEIFVNEKHFPKRRKPVRGDKMQQGPEKSKQRKSYADSGPNKPATKRGKSGRAVPPKYLDPVTGNSWSGRGKQPNWIKARLEAGHAIQDFLIVRGEGGNIAG